jgi:enoyl-CoA hydratase/carnithine racemase
VAAIEEAPQPVIAMVHGFCLGGGLELAMSADLRVAGAGATLGLPETTLGIIPGGGGTQRLARLVGPARAKRLIFTGRRLGAAEALQWGLVDEVTPDAELRASVAALAAELAARAPLALAAAKVAIRRGLETDLATGLALEAAMWGVLFGTADRVEGTTAFLEKRRAEFEGR